ncbi:hypothetical protein ACW5EG_06370 [Luteimonas sp. A611]
MRFLVIKQDTSLQALTAQLVKDGTSEPAALDRLRALNPHLDLQRVGKGAVLLVPDSPGYQAEGEKAGDDGFDLFAREVATALREGTTRATDALAAAEAQEKEVGKLFKSAAIRKLSDEDSALRERLDTVASRASAASKESKELTPQLEALKKGAAEELKKLRELLG